LGRIGAEARAAVPKLIAALQSMRLPPDFAEYDPDEADASEYDLNGYGSSEYLPRLHALGGIGAEARAAVPEVLRLANSNNAPVRHAAVLALARIDPVHRSLVRRMRSLFAEL